MWALSDSALNVDSDNATFYGRRRYVAKVRAERVKGVGAKLWKKIDFHVDLNQLKTELILPRTPIPTLMTGGLSIF